MLRRFSRRMNVEVRVPCTPTVRQVRARLRSRTSPPQDRDLLHHNNIVAAQHRYLRHQPPSSTTTCRKTPGLRRPHRRTASAGASGCALTFVEPDGVDHCRSRFHVRRAPAMEDLEGFSPTRPHPALPPPTVKKVNDAIASASKVSGSRQGNHRLWTARRLRLHDLALLKGAPSCGSQRTPRRAITTTRDWSTPSAWM